MTLRLDDAFYFIFNTLPFYCHMAESFVRKKNVMNCFILKALTIFLYHVNLKLMTTASAGAQGLCQEFPPIEMS